MNDDSNLERTTKAAVDGYNLVTTLDANIQGIVERKLQEYNDTYKMRQEKETAPRMWAASSWM